MSISIFLPTNSHCLSCCKHQVTAGSGHTVASSVVDGAQVRYQASKQPSFLSMKRRSSLHITNCEAFVGKILTNDDNVTHSPEDTVPRGLQGVFLFCFFHNPAKKIHTLTFVPLGRLWVTHDRSLRTFWLAGREIARAWHKRWVKSNENRAYRDLCWWTPVKSLFTDIEPPPRTVLLRQSQNNANVRFWL